MKNELDYISNRFHRKIIDLSIKYNKTNVVVDFYDKENDCSVKLRLQNKDKNYIISEIEDSLKTNKFLKKG